MRPMADLQRITVPLFIVLDWYSLMLVRTVRFVCCSEAYATECVDVLARGGCGFLRSRTKDQNDCVFWGISTNMIEEKWPLLMNEV